VVFWTVAGDIYNLADELEDRLFEHSPMLGGIPRAVLLNFYQHTKSLASAFLLPLLWFMLPLPIFLQLLVHHVQHLRRLPKLRLLPIVRHNYYFC